MRRLMEIGTTEELWSMSYPDFMSPTLEEFQHILGLCNAFWVYEGEPAREKPHALLTSGQHSNGFINLGAVLKEYEQFRKLLASTLLARLHVFGVSCSIEGVVGSDSSATDLAGDVANILGTRHIKMIKVEDEHGKRQEWPEGQELIRPTDVLLHVEELVTTSSSAEAVQQGIAKVHPFRVLYFPMLPLVVDRSDPDHGIIMIRGLNVLPLFRIPIRNFNRSECPYCEVGSNAVAPKANWGYLTQS